MEKEEVEKLRAQQRDFARKTLESKVFQNVLGSNQVRSNQSLYGSLGVQGAEATSSEVMGSNEATQARNTAYEKAKTRGDKLGIYGEPAITNYEVSAEMVEQIEEAKKRLSLEDLTQIVKGIATGLKFDLPEELKNYVPGE
ncbi:MAG: hypothetical protein NTW17_00135, partial [Candidatus Pacearchaeota archaeon]|nr:hypothetical protein [Candidatus Pacearchaeota archaeon]